MVDINNPVLDFTAMDRCDGCGAQAYVLAQHDELGEFLFCVHHCREHYNTLRRAGWEIFGNSDTIASLADNVHV